MREAVSRVDGVMAIMRESNINTDAIIPSKWLRSANPDFGQGLFGNLRYDEDGRERPEFILNRPGYRNASILLCGENFGCGSSREAAVWALVQFGIRCVLAPSFADIFYENAFRNGLIPGLIDHSTLEELAGADPVAAQATFHVDLGELEIAASDGTRHPFRIPPLRARALMMGYDEIDMTMRHAPEIETYLRRSKHENNWLFPDSLGLDVAIASVDPPEA
ncbi:3-isopropylmalate dehydratase small subunit [Mesorhizobium sp. BR1-1-13]|uniref:3-isopropylmalate dehydratase small subunit n=1 Tax=Mesorhizobium sp. BR1-1-13 TaxID=2876656 RepID=UPI001CD134B1|nr:3-isopropylmalate dehydratase small subunit [Mesorhizobium sp. BR1-1-13]MBZ9942293.1 3-isopropylmalate dehydratase small subunit [Mesorhizobium sp. BR1-1-13]